MKKKIKIISPVDNSVFAERELAADYEIAATLNAALKGQKDWAALSLEARAKLCHQAVDAMLAMKEDCAREITWQMGRPIQYSPGELLGLEERSRYMIDIAASALADIEIDQNKSKPGPRRFIRSNPLGVVLTVAPWNYPYLTAINSIIPALMAGNCVILKHSAQTLLCAERLLQAFSRAGLPDGVFQILHMDRIDCLRLAQRKEINFVAFTGSVSAGQAFEKALAGHVKGLSLELGGKDAAYVRPDADIKFSAEQLVDGAFFNSGQSCCGIERIYLHEAIYSEFVDVFVETVKQYKLGNPADKETTLGPMVSSRAARFVREQITQARDLGAFSCIGESDFPQYNESTAYLAPQVLLEVNHSMPIMKQESFGPVVGIMKVKDDDEAINLINDSDFGLTASIWSNHEEQAIGLGDKIQAGTVFLNRCDYLDPALTWTGVKMSGRGCALSTLGYRQLTQAKSFYIRS